MTAVSPLPHRAVASSLAPARSPRAGGPVRLRPRCAGLGVLRAAAAAPDLQPVRQRGGRLVSRRSARPGTDSLPRPLSVAASCWTRCRQRLPRWLRSAATCRRACRCSSAWARRAAGGVHRWPQVRIDGVPSAAVLPADRWAGRCHPGSNAAAFEPGELFLLSVTNPASFDSRYFGPVSASAVIGVAHPVWLEITPMMAADSLHVAVHLIVPSGVSFCWLSPCRRACSAGAFAPHFALPPAQPSNVQASCLERARPAAMAAFAGALAAQRSSAAGPPLPGATARGKGGRQDKRTRHRAASKASLHMGVARHGAASPPCRVGREARANAGMSACFARPDTPELAGSAAMTDRRDDDFRIRPSAPKNRGQGFVSKVLKQAARPAAASPRCAVWRIGGSTGQRAGQRPGSRLGRGHTAARFAGRS
jgi:hypothetical protein